VSTVYAIAECLSPEVERLLGTSVEIGATFRLLQAQTAP